MLWVEETCGPLVPSPVELSGGDHQLPRCWWVVWDQSCVFMILQAGEVSVLSSLGDPQEAMGAGPPLAEKGSLHL